MPRRKIPLIKVKPSGFPVESIDMYRHTQKDMPYLRLSCIYGSEPFEIKISRSTLERGEDPRLFFDNAEKELLAV